MKVAVIMPLADQRGGAELLLLHFLKNIRLTRIEPVVVFLEAGPLVHAARQSGVEAVVIDAGRLRDPVRWRKAIIAISEVAAAHGCDCILSWMPKAQLYGGPAGRRAGIPAIWYQHGLPSRRHWMDVAMTLLPAAGIIACSQFAADAQIRLRPRRPLAVVHPCVDPSVFRVSEPGETEALRRRLGLPAEGPVVGMVARLQRWKGVHVLIRAMKAVAGQFPEAKAVIVGGRHELEPAYQEELRSLIRELGLNEQVILADFQENVRDWMAAMDIVIHASDREPFGMVIIEAMALGRPVIAGSEGGPREIITDGYDGLLVGYEDAVGLAEAILRLLKNPDAARKMACHGARRAQDFTAEQFVRKMERAIDLFTTAERRLHPA